MAIADNQLRNGMATADETTKQNATAQVESIQEDLSDTAEVIKKPFEHPVDEAKIPSPVELTPDQTEKYDKVLEAASSLTSVPTSLAKGASESPLTDDERMFMTRECLLRYLRATKWNAEEAVNRVRTTLAWRREYNINKLTADYISIENETGKQVVLGYDVEGRPCLYLIPSQQNTEKSPKQVEHLVFMLERVIDLMPPGQENLALVINFNETKSGQNATMGQARQTVSILQNHYPERLGRALVINIPWVIWGFFKIIKPFIDPVTVEKLKFNEDLRQHVPPAQLLQSAGGDLRFEYDHAIYWPALNQLADQRRETMRQRWTEAGQRVGESEYYLRGGTDKSQFAS